MSDVDSSPHSALWTIAKPQAPGNVNNICINDSQKEEEEEEEKNEYLYFQIIFQNAYS